MAATRPSDARGDHGQVRRLRPGDTDEAVHDAPDRSEQADEGRSGADGRQQPDAARQAAARPGDDALQSRRDAIHRAGRFLPLRQGDLRPCRGDQRGNVPIGYQGARLLACALRVQQGSQRPPQ